LVFARRWLGTLELGVGERLFDGVGEPRGLELVRCVAAPAVMHLRFAKR